MKRSIEQIQFLFQDQDIAVVIKPPMVVVNNANTISEENTLQTWWMAQLGADQAKRASWSSLVPAEFSDEYGSPEEIFAERGGIVHRLDKETSGAIVLAKNPGALVNLLQQFRERQVHKKYTCLVHGKFQVQADTIQLPLGRSSENRTKFAVEADGRQAETTYRVVRFFPSLDVDQLISEGVGSEIRNFRKRVRTVYQGFSLVECEPKTGRTHQIRVHMAHLHHPIVSDQAYLGKKRAQLDEAWCPRLFLHASQVEFMHPRTKARMVCVAPLWPDLVHAQSFLCDGAEHEKGGAP